MFEMGTFQVEEVPELELPLLLEELAKNLERTSRIYTSIAIRLKKGLLRDAELIVYRAQDPLYKSFIFCTPYISSKTLQSMSATWDPNEISDAIVGQLFSSVPNWDWNSPFHVYYSSYDMKKQFENLFASKLIAANTTSLTECHPKNRFITMTATSMDLQIPKVPCNYELGPLPPSAAPLMLSHWGYNFKDTSEGLAERIRSYGGVSASYKDYSDNGDPTGKVVGWSQLYMNGAIGMTFTIPEHRKQGLGGAITATMVKQVLEEALTAFVIIDEENKNSLEFHEKLGFKVHHDTGFSLYLPSGTTIHQIMNQEIMK